MPSSEKGKAKKNPARERRVVRKEKKSTQAKVTDNQQLNTHDSMENVETVESMDTEHLIVGTSRRTKLKVKARVQESRNPRCKEISESDNSEQVEDWNPSSNTSAQQPKPSQVNKHEWMRRKGFLDIFTGKQQETSVRGKLGRSVSSQSD